MDYVTFIKCQLVCTKLTLEPLWLKMGHVIPDVQEEINPRSQPKDSTSVLMRGGVPVFLLLVALSLADAFSLLHKPLFLRRASQAACSPSAVQQRLSAQHGLRPAGSLKQVLRMSGGAGSCTAVAVYVTVKAGALPGSRAAKQLGKPRSAIKRWRFPASVP